jgi:hypothetical protein
VKAKAAIEPNSKTAVVQVPVTIALLNAYLPKFPAEKALPKTPKSQDVGSDNGLRDISSLLFIAENAIHSSGTK